MLCLFCFRICNARYVFFCFRNTPFFPIFSVPIRFVIKYCIVLGISTLPHQKTGEEVPLYLYQDEEGNQAIPIPELFWKVAYDPIHKAGIALLGVNNPYQTDISKSIICKDVSQKIGWLNFDLTKVESGYMYACSIPDLRNVIKNLPNFKVSKLLS